MMSRALIIVVSLVFCQADWVAYTESTSVQKGSLLTIELILTISDGYHIQHVAPEDPYLIPTELTLVLPETWELKKIAFPESESFLLEGTVTPLQVYSEKVKVDIVVDTKDAPLMAKRIPATLNYQACDSVKCYYPRALHFEIEL